MRSLTITGEHTAEKAAERLGGEVEIAVVTLGPEGALAHADGSTIHVPGFEMKTVDMPPAPRRRSTQTRR